jgi:hypothetical protein
MKSYVLRFGIAILTFVVGVIAATAFSSRHVPSDTPPSLITSEVAESQPDRIAVPVPEERHAISRRVVGYVKDHENHPVAGADVCANPHGGGLGNHPVRGVEAGRKFHA